MVLGKDGIYLEIVSNKIEFLKYTRIIKMEYVKDINYLTKSLVDLSHLERKLSSSKKVEWKCSKCNKNWTEGISVRKRYTKCPQCQTRKRTTQTCLKKDCEKRASYNFYFLKWSGRCKKHKKEGMGKVTVKTCEKCEAQPSFNFEGQEPCFCKKHSLNGMMNVIKVRLCRSCSKQATFNFEGENMVYAARNIWKKE